MDGSRLHRSSDGGAVTPPTISYDQLAAWKEEGVPLPPRPIMFDVDHPVKGVLGIARVLMQTGAELSFCTGILYRSLGLGSPYNTRIPIRASGGCGVTPAYPRSNLLRVEPHLIREMCRPRPNLKFTGLAKNLGQL
jgi:hypothetical protein